MGFLEIVEQAKAFLERNRRVSFRGFALEFELDDEALDALVEELVDVQQVAALEGKVLSWMGSARAEASAPDPGAHMAAGVSSERIAAPDVAEAERRQIAVMFCDLVDFTHLSEILDPEDLHRTVQEYQKACTRSVADYDGWIAQYLGDGVLAYFGFPMAHEDDGRRAVRASLAVLTALPSLNDRLRRELPPFPDVPLRVRIAVHTGPVVVAELGAAGRREPAALGSTPNLASRLQGIAEPNAILISAATRRLVGQDFALRDLGDIRLKGVTDPVHVFHVLGESGLGDTSNDESAAPLVGRERELERLTARWALVREGEGQLVVVEGEPGIGKTRLVHSFRQRLGPWAATWLELRCSPYHCHSSLHPVIELLASVFGLQQGDPPEERLRKLAQAVAEVRPSNPEVLPLFAALLSLPDPDTVPPAPSSPEVRRRRTLDALVTWLLRPRDDRLTVLVVEDLQWIDPSSRELLAMVVERLRSSGALVVLTHRPGVEVTWVAAPWTETLVLGALTPDETLRMTRAVLGPCNLPPALIDTVARRTDGVPLFIEELAKSVAESMLATDGDTGTEAPPRLLELSIPATSRMCRISTRAASKPASPVAPVQSS